MLDLLGSVLSITKTTVDVATKPLVDSVKFADKSMKDLASILSDEEDG